MEEKQVLESWKEIAAYLKRSYKTLRRLERDHGLPVHRIEDSPKARVFAYKDEIDRWLQEIQQAGRTSKGVTKIKKPLMVITLILFCVSAGIIGLVLWHPWFSVNDGWSQSNKPNLVIPYFENNTGDQNFEYLRRGFSEWFIADLSQSRFINVLSGDRTFTILQMLNLENEDRYSSEDLASIAKQGGADYLVRGNYIKVGDHFIITVMLQKPQTGEIVGSIKKESTSEAELASKVDELTRYIKINLLLTSKQIASDTDKEVGKITTSSPEAYKYYIEGVKYNSLGEFQLALQFLERAISIDPGFALAYRIMAGCYLDLGYYPKWEESIQRAMELRDRISEREQHLIQGNFYTWSRSEREFDKAIDSFDKLLEFFPEDYIGNKNLGNIYLSLEQWDEAIERFDILIKNRVDSIWPYANISQAYMAKGMYEDAKDVLEGYVENFPDNFAIHRRLALNYFHQGKLDLAFIEIDKSIALNPVFSGNTLTKGEIFCCRGDMTKAEKEYQELLESEEQPNHIMGAYKLASLYLLQGRFTKSQEFSKKGISLAKKIRVGWGEKWGYLYMAYIHIRLGNLEQALEYFNKVLADAGDYETSEEERLDLYFKGLAYLEMGSISDAQKTADELEKAVKISANEKLKRMHYLLLGMLELKKGNYSEAIELNKRAVSLMPSQYLLDGNTQALYYDPLALSHYLAGNLEVSQKEYERITNLTSGRLYWGDIYAKAFYMLGKIHEELGNTAKSIEHYQKFLTIWKDADPGIAEVEDATKRLGGLKSK